MSNLPHTRSLELGTIESAPIELGISEQDSATSCAAYALEQQPSCPSLSHGQTTLDPESATEFTEHSNCIRRDSDAPELFFHSDEDDQQLTSLISPLVVTAARYNTQSQRVSEVRFSVNKLHSCESHCLCTCHGNCRYKSPGALKELVGSLFIGYTGLPMLARKCNLYTCVNRSSRNIWVSYTFPTWFVKKTFDFIAKSSVVSGLRFELTLRNRIDASIGVNIISLAHNGNIHGIVNLLKEGKGSLTDVESFEGYSCFFVCINI